MLINMGRTRRAKSRELQRLRTERVERSFADVCETGGARRIWLRGFVDVTKRYLITAAAHNLGRALRMLFGMGKPRSLQGGFGLATLAQWAILWFLSSTARAAQRFNPALQLSAA